VVAYVVRLSLLFTSMLRSGANVGKNCYPPLVAVGIICKVYNVMRCLRLPPWSVVQIVYYCCSAVNIIPDIVMRYTSRLIILLQYTPKANGRKKFKGKHRSKLLIYMFGTVVVIKPVSLSRSRCVRWRRRKKCLFTWKFQDENCEKRFTARPRAPNCARVNVICEWFIIYFFFFFF